MTADRLLMLVGGVMVTIAVLVLVATMVEHRLPGGPADDRDDGWAADDEEIVGGW